MRLAACEGVDPEIAGSGGAIVVVEKARAVLGEGRMAAGRLVYAFWNGQGRRLVGGEIVQVDIFIAVDVGAEGDALAIGRKFAAANFPFVLGEPLDRLHGEISDRLTFHADAEKADIVVAILSIR